MSRPRKSLDQNFVKINIKLTRDDFTLLQKACEQREQVEAAHVPYGRIIGELIREHLGNLVPVKPGKSGRFSVA